MWVITLQDGNSLTANQGHPFNTPEGWRDAILLKKGGKLLLKGDGDSAQTVEIASVTHRTEIQTTYNLEVANAHTFFVGEEGVWVHNGASGGSGGNKGKKGCDFRGGKKQDRDNWYGEDKNYPVLKDWWRRTGKKKLAWISKIMMLFLRLQWFFANAMEVAGNDYSPYGGGVN